MGLLSRSLSTSGFPGDRRGLPVAYGINQVPHRALVKATSNGLRHLK